MTHRGSTLVEVLFVMVGLATFSAMTVLAVAAIRQRAAIEANSAHLETAQNVLESWRSGAAIDAPGWTVAVSTPAPGIEVLRLRRPGLAVSTMRATSTGRAP